MSKNIQEFQQTIKEAISFKGVGLHTGKAVNMQILPAKTGFGIRFKRVDLKDVNMFKDDVEYVVDTSRGTTLEHNGARVSTADHIIAALAGRGLDNAYIEFDV